MQLRKLSTLQIVFIYNTYMKEDFPPDELKPVKAILDMMDRGIYECLGLYHDEEFLAYAFLVKNQERKTLLLDYLAVCRNYRAGGYGSAFLNLMKEYYREESALLLECESERTAPDEEQRRIRRRRIAFYKRNGCLTTRTKSWLFGVEYDILYLPFQVEKPDVTAELRALYEQMFPPQVFARYGRVWNRRSRILGAARWEQEGWMEQKSLCDAIAIGDAVPKVISFVGAGGKTTTMYQLADELAEQGLRVLVTTTTHIRRPADGQTAVITDIRELFDWRWEGRILTAGKPVEHGGDKLTAPEGLEDAETMELLSQMIDVILIEADGAKELPLKVPAEYEPVLLPQTRLVIACAGLDAVGRSFRETCFRMEQEGGWLKRSPEDTVEPEDVALILMDERGSRRYVSELQFRIVLNKADSEKEREAAAEIIHSLPKMLQEICAMTSYERD